MLSFVHHSQYVNHWYCKICYNLRVQETEQHCYVRLEGHSSSGCYTPARYSDLHCSQTLLQRFDDAVITFITFLEVITASSKCCNKVCEQFEQCMSEYRAGYNSIVATLFAPVLEVGCTGY